MTDLSPDFSSEQEYIKSCLGAIIFDQMIPAPPQLLDWEVFYLCLKQNRVVGLFASKLNICRNCWPKEFTDRLQRDRVRTLFSADAYASELVRVLSVLRETNIPVIVLKGWALIQSLYDGDYSRRVFCDVDLLVPKEHAIQAMDSISSLGYSSPEEMRPNFVWEYDIHRVFLSPLFSEPVQYQVVIELHWGLSHIPYFDQPIDFEGVFARSHPIFIKGQPAAELSLEDHLVYSCTHQLHHLHDSALSRPYELAAWIVKYGSEVNWEMIGSRAYQWKVGFALKKVMNQVESLWPGTIPPHALTIIDQVKPRLGERLIIWLEKLNPEFFHVPIVFATLPFSKRFGYLSKLLLPARSYMQKRYGMTPIMGFWPTLYFNRFKIVMDRIFGLIRPKRKTR